MPLDANELREILLTLNQTDIAELHFKTADFELNLKRALRSPWQLRPWSLQ
ncbi:MAG: hypothetical protein HC860_20570, partial [Alkalinema sp. RU_4_3]|nr:hypothetical protein [Alkalinema sp. RU_4_3]